LTTVFFSVGHIAGFIRASSCSIDIGVPGGDAGGATPVPIPNTAVKPSRADGTALVTAWESRSPPGLETTMPGLISPGIVIFDAGSAHRIRPISEK
jgi:hypothetical protein